MGFSGNTYSLPAGSIVTNGQASDASQHNTPLNDIASALTTVKTEANAAAVAATLASTSNGEGASLVGIEDAGGIITATDVEGALAENRTAIDAIEADYLTSSDVGSSVQAYDAGLASIAGLTTAADKMLYATASDTYAVADLTAAGRAILDDADADAQLTTLGFGASGKLIAALAAIGLAGSAVVVDAAGTGFEQRPGVFFYTFIADATYGFGEGDDVAAMNTLVAAINAAGSALRSDYLNIRVKFLDGITYDLRDAAEDGIDPILVSNVVFETGKGTQFRMQKAPIAVLGSAAQFIENFWLLDPHAHVATADTPTASAALVYGVNAARIVIERPQCYRVPHLLKGVVSSSGTLTTILIDDPYHVGLPDYHAVDIDSTAATAAAGLYLVNGRGFPYAPPANPAIVPSAISAITQAANAQVTTGSAHGLVTGDKVAIGSVAGMTQINGTVDTITVVDATNFTLDNTDSTGFTAYSSGGKVAELHWGYDYGKAVVRIDGKWDTAMIVGGVWQHYAYLWSLRATASMSFIFDIDVTFDYGGAGRFDITFAGGSVSHPIVRGGWTFVMNDAFMKRTAAGAGNLIAAEVTGHRVGLLGGDFMSDATGRVGDVTLRNNTIVGLGRVKSGGGAVADFAAAANRPVIDGNVCLDPDTHYGAGAGTWLKAATGVKLAAAVVRADVTDNEMFATTTNYNITEPSSGIGRKLRGNMCRDGLLPEYLKAAAPSVGASPYTYVNRSGARQRVHLSGGTVTNVTHSYLSGARAELFITIGTPTDFFVERGMSVQVFHSSAPTMTVFTLPD